MRKLLTTLTLILLLAACGGGDNSVANSTEDTADTVSDPTEDAWLRVDATGDRESFTWKIDGKRVDADGLKAAMEKYAGKTDQKGGLKGKNADGYSGNPILFSAPPGVTSQSYLALLEMAATVGVHRVRVELAPSKGKAMRQWIELPVSEGLGDSAAHMELRLLHNGELLLFHAYYQERRAGGIVPEDAPPSPPPVGPTKLADATVSRKELFGDGVNVSLYEKARKALVSGIRDFRDGIEPPPRRIQIAPSASDRPAPGDYASWGALYFAVDAANRAGGGHVTFRFTDALGRYD